MKSERPRLHERLTVTLWTLVASPAVWAAHFLFSYLWAAISCAKVGEFATFPTLFAIGTLFALMMIGVVGWIGWKHEQIPGGPPPHQDSTDIDRIRFLAKSTMMLSALSFVGVVFTALPVVFLRQCT